MLLDGSTFDVIGEYGAAEEAVSRSMLMRDMQGMVFSVSVRQDKGFSWDQLIVRGGKTTLTLRVGLGFDKENLPVPLELSVKKDTVLRALYKDGQTSPELRKMQKAVRELPEEFQIGLKTLLALSNSDEAVGFLTVPPTLSMLEPLFEERISAATILEQTPLGPGQIDAIQSVAP